MSSPHTATPGDDAPHDTHTTHMIDIPYRGAFVPRDSPKEPPEITPIPRINHDTAAATEPSQQQQQQPPPPPPHLPDRYQALVGRFVDEFGNILDDDGTVLGRVEGDLPSMVGRPVSEKGEILDGDGEVVGHVVEDLTALPELQELDGALRVDASGNIYNENGEAIGRLNEARPGGRAQEQQQPQRQPSYGSSPGGPSPAAPAPRPASAPNPSEIYLDVKSTYDGIQLIIKIPSIFNRDKDNNNVPEDMKGTTR